MQQVENVRGRLSQWNPQAQWVQLGLLSASIMAPLIGRWNELRATERARALREEAEARLRGMRTQLPWQRNDVLDQVAALLKPSAGGVSDTSIARGKAITRLWLVGVGVGLVAAGAGAYVLVRRRIERSAEEPLVDLPLTSMNGYAKGAGNGFNGSARTPAGAAAPNMPVIADEQASGQPVAQADQWPAPSVRADVTDAGAATRTDEGAPVDAMQLEDAPFIGNIRTMIYHEADDDNLPAEENRIYFMSEEEARAAGYRRDRDEVAATETESQAQSNA